MKRHGAWLAATITTLLPFGPSAAGAETLAVFTKSAGNPIAKAVRAGVEQVAKANSFTVFHYIPTSPDNPRQQTALVDEALSAKRDAIVFTPVDVKAMAPAVEKINAANVPLVNVSDRLTGGTAIAFIGSDDYAIAIETATPAVPIPMPAAAEPAPTSALIVDVSVAVSATVSAAASASAELSRGGRT